MSVKTSNLRVMIVPISEAAYDYAKELRQTIRKGGIHVDADCSDKKMQKKVRGVASTSTMCVSRQYRSEQLLMRGAVAKVWSKV
eukprot:scaffold12539_cov19-Tisochrysis_lutea.AAC.7